MEGIITGKNKKGNIILRKTFSEKGGGFSLIELTVAMTIFALLTAFGYGAYFQARRQAQLNEYSEKIINMIRDAQSNAIAVKKGPYNRDTKAWLVSVPKSTGGNVRLYQVYQEASNSTYLKTNTTQADNIDLPTGMSVDTKRTLTGTTGNTALIQFSTPFSKGYFVVSPSNYYSCDVDGTGAPIPCYWVTDGSRPAKDWYVHEPNTRLLASNDSFDIILSIGGLSKTINVKPNGDIYVQ